MRKTKQIRALERKILQDCWKATWLPIVIGFAGELLASAVSVFTARLLGSFADAVFSLNWEIGATAGLQMALCLVLSIAVVPLVSGAEEYVMTVCSLRHDRMVMGRYLRKTFRSATQLDAGSVEQRIERDPIELRCDCCVMVEYAVVAPVTLLLLLRYALPVSPLYTALVFGVSLVKLAVPLAVRRLEGRYDKETRAYRTSVHSYESEITRNPLAVKLYGLKEAFLRRMDDAYQTYFSTVEKKDLRCRQLATNLSGFLDTFCTLAILLSGAALISHGAVSPGAVASMVGYFGIFNQIISQVGTILRRTPKFGNTMERMRLFYEDKEKTEGETAGPFASLSARGLSFSFEENGKPALSNVDFTVKRGEKVAIVGPNGSGKSTLIKMICGLLPSDGLFVNGKPLDALSPLSLREQIAYAPQDPILFTGTVLENVEIGGMGAGDARGGTRAESRKTAERAVRIMETLGIGALKSRQVGRNTVVGGSDGREKEEEKGGLITGGPMTGDPTEGDMTQTQNAADSGSGLSGGEKQKISLARALMKDAPLLILDEPGNHLDAETLGFLREFIRASDKTVLFVSHDPVLTACADHVIRLPGRETDAKGKEGKTGRLVGKTNCL